MSDMLDWGDYRASLRNNPAVWGILGDVMGGTGRLTSIPGRGFVWQIDSREYVYGDDEAAYLKWLIDARMLKTELIENLLPANYIQRLVPTRAAEAVTSEQPLRLDMGAGNFPKEGYISVDAYTGADIVAPMWDVPLPDGSASEIISDHALEHVAKAQVVPVLREWHRLLEPGARAIVIVPDLVWCCQNYLAWQTNDWHMDTIFGGQGHDGEFHRTGFTHKLLRQYAEEAGFRVIEDGTVDSHGQPSIRIVMRKP